MTTISDYLYTFWLPLALLLGASLDLLAGRLRSPKRLEERLECATQGVASQANAERHLAAWGNAGVALLTLAALGFTSTLLFFAELAGAWTKVAVTTLIIYFCLNGRKIAQIRRTPAAALAHDRDENPEHFDPRAAEETRRPASNAF